MDHNDNPMRRRDFIKGAASVAVTGLTAGAASAQSPAAQTPPAHPPGMVIREKDPENLEYPFGALDGPLTPSETFYVRSHFPVPDLQAATWRLRVEGAVRKTLELSYEDLLAMPTKTVSATLECAGNGRVFLAPQKKGAQWQLGAVSNAEWRGVPLSAVLERAGVKQGAVEVVLEGADKGEIKDPPKPDEPIHFSRSLPMERAMRPEVLLATHMNGEPLAPSHGFPLRAVVPGWYGVASVKWLARLVVVETPYQGYFQTVDYAVWKEENGLKSRVPITEMLVKAEIARPEVHETVAAGSLYLMRGAAWTGDSEIAKVEVSADGGKTWEAARLVGAAPRFTWQLWEHPWRVPAERGKATLMARATDKRGHTQPMERQPDRESYLINHVLPIDVAVR